jgi:hypothetical protein
MHTAKLIHDRVADAIRLRWLGGESWKRSAMLEAAALSDKEADALLAYLAAHPGVAINDVFLANALAARLGRTLQWARRDILTEVAA